MLTLLEFLQHTKLLKLLVRESDGKTQDSLSATSAKLTLFFQDRVSGLSVSPLKGSCRVSTSACWHYPTTSKHARPLKALLYLQVQDKKVCQHPATLLPDVSDVRWRCSILLGQQRYLHNWLYLQSTEQGTSGPEDEELSTCKFKAEYSCFPIAGSLSLSPGFLEACGWKIVSQTLAELSLPSTGIKYVAKFGLCRHKKKSAVFLFKEVFMSRRIFLAHCFFLFIFACVACCSHSTVFSFHPHPRSCSSCAACGHDCAHICVPARGYALRSHRFSKLLCARHLHSRWNAMTLLTVSLEVCKSHL